MPDDHLIDAVAGEKILIDFGPVTRKDDAGITQAINLRAAGIRIRMMAKRRRADADADAVIDHQYDFGVTEGDGITVPNVAPFNSGYVEIAPDETRVLAESTLLGFEVALREPDGRITKLRSGTLKILGSVARSDP